MKCHGGCQFWANSVSILLGSHWASYPFLIHLTLHHLPLFFLFFVPQMKTLPESSVTIGFAFSHCYQRCHLSCWLCLLCYQFYQSYQEICSWSLWLSSLWSQWLSGPRCVQLAWFRGQGQLGSLTTRITATHSPSSTAHQDKEFSTPDPMEISPSSQSSLQLLFHTWT